MLLDLETHPPAAAIDRVTIDIEPTPARVLQHTLFARPHPTPEQLSTLLARLGALMGGIAIGAPVPVDSHRPGAFAMHPFAIERRETRPNAGRPEPGARSLEPGTPRAKPPRPRPDLRAAALPAAVPARVAVDADRRPLRHDRSPRVRWWRHPHVRRSVENVGGVVGRRRSGRAAEGAGEGADAGQAGQVAARSGSRGVGPEEWDVALADGAMYRISRSRKTPG